MADFPEPFWYPNTDFAAYHKDERWAKPIKQIQTCLNCEPWQAWVVLCQLVNINTIASEVIEERLRDREPWEDPEDDDE